MPVSVRGGTALPPNPLSAHISASQPLQGSSLPPNPLAGHLAATGDPTASQQTQSPLTGYANRIVHEQIDPGFVQHLKALSLADPTFQTRLNAETERIRSQIEGKQNSSPLAIAGNAIEGAANPLEWVKGAIQGAPEVAHGIGKAIHGNVGGGAEQAGLGALGVAGILPFGKAAGVIGDAVRVSRTAEEAGQHVADASQKALIEGHGLKYSGGLGNAPRVPPGEVTPETGGELGANAREALKGAGSARNEQAALQSEARGQQAAKGLAAREVAGGGLAGHAAERAAQSGELPKVFFNNKIRELDQNTFEDLVRHAQNSPVLRTFEQGKAVDALKKLGNGLVPAKNEQAILERVFGKETADTLRSTVQSKGDIVRSLLNVPRALKSTLDFSAPFRQGLVMGVHNPKVFAKAFGPMFKAWMSEDYFQKNIMDEIHSRPTYPLMDKAGVPFTEIGRSAKGVGDLSDREEAFMTNYAERLPLGIGKIVRSSDRAYVGFLDRIRADAFDDLTQKLAMQGHDLNDEHLLKSVGDFIGSATGRGNLPALQAHTASLNALLFSPRLMMSRLNFLGFGGEGLKSVLPGSYYMSLHPAVRVEAWKSLIGLGATAVSILELAKLGGLKVVTDPTNADFGKVKAGNTRFDILGGFQQYIRLGAELAEQKITSSTTGKSENLGNGFGKSTTMDILKRFFEGKLSPVPSALASAAEQSSFTGSVKSAKFWKGQAPIPFMAQDVYDALRTPGTPLGAKIVGPVVDTFGVGMQSYAPQAPKTNGNTTTGGGTGYWSSGSTGGGQGYWGP